MSKILRLDRNIIDRSVEKLGIRGHFDSVVTDKFGRQHQHQSGENYIYPEFYEALAKHLGATDANFANIEFDNPFTASGIAVNGEDGIIIGEYAAPYIENHYSMVSVISNTATQFICTGTFTNGSGGSLDMVNPLLGNGWWFNPLVPIPAFTNYWVATFTTFTLTTVPSTEVLTITWTINFTAH